MAIDSKQLTVRPMGPSQTTAAGSTQSSAGAQAPAAPQGGEAKPRDSFAAHTHGPRCGCNGPKMSGEELAKVEQKVAQKIAEQRSAGPRSEPGAPSAAEPRVIDVYFHVVTRGNGPSNGDVPQEQIEAQIQVLNDAYREAGFEFRLVEVDRTNNGRWYTAQPGSRAETDMKASLRKGGADALNIYTSQPSGGILGWATFPSDYKADPLDDGIVLLNTTLPGGTSAPYNEGDTGTHEVGHWMGLYHTFNQPKGAGLPLGDMVDDTPAHNQNFGKPPPTTDTLPNEPGLDPVHNFMNYTDDDWMFEFTPGQVDRMQAQWALFRETAKPEPKAAAA
jgi:hypothetical protein